MSKVIVIGDGPGGLSAALFLAKNGVDVTVFGEDNTAMHYALLYNYLGIPEITGTDFQAIAVEQVKGFGAELVPARISHVERDGDGFVVITKEGARHPADYVIFSEGKAARLAAQFGIEKTEDGLVVDRHGRTGIDRAYAVGRGTRINRSQAIISAGEGAAAALDILSTERGENFNDYDTPPKEE